MFNIVSFCVHNFLKFFVSSLPSQFYRNHPPCFRLCVGEKIVVWEGGQPFLQPFFKNLFILESRDSLQYMFTVNCSICDAREYQQQTFLYNKDSQKNMALESVYCDPIACPFRTYYRTCKTTAF